MPLGIQRSTAEPMKVKHPFKKKALAPQGWGDESTATSAFYANKQTKCLNQVEVKIVKN